MRYVVIAAGIFLIAQLSGCASSWLYDKQSDEKATAAKASYADTKLASVLKVERDNLNALESKEVDAFTSSLLAQRDLALLSLLVDGEQPFNSRLYEAVKMRLDEIATPNDSVSWENYKVAFEAAEMAEATERKERKLLESFIAGGQDLDSSKYPACKNEKRVLFENGITLASVEQAVKDEHFKPSKATNVGELEKRYQTYAKTCLTLIDAEATLSKIPLLKKQREDFRVKKADLTSLEAKAKGAAAKLKAATEKVAQAQKNRDAMIIPPDRSCKKPKEAASPDATSQPSAAPGDKAPRLLTAEGASDKPGRVPDNLVDDDEEKKAQNSLCEAIEDLKKLGAFGKKLLNEERLKKISIILAATSGTLSTDDPDVPPALALLSTSVRFATSMDAYGAAQTKILPAVEPLVIEKQMAEVQFAFSKQTIEIQKARVAFAQQKVDAFNEELALLVKARSYLDPVENVLTCSAMAYSKNKSAPPAACVQMSALAKKAVFQTLKSGEIQTAFRRAFRGISAYAQSITGPRAKLESIDVREGLIGYRESLILSEAALSSWDVLINTPLSQLQTYYGNKVKPSEIAQFLQALGVIGIAVNVK
jgi:hypothetical protein